MRTSFVFCLLASGAAMWGADWLTDGKDPQRTNWQKDEKILTPTNVKGMKLLWKVQLPNESRRMHALLPTLIVENVRTSSGPKEIAIATGVSDNIFGIDAASGKVLWKKHFSSAYS